MQTPVEAARMLRQYVEVYGPAGALTRVMDHALRPFGLQSWQRRQRDNRTYYLETAPRRAAARRAGPAPAVLFLPQCPAPNTYAITKMCAELGVRMADRRAPDVKLAVLWLDATVVPPADREAAGLRVLNGRCLDIGKSVVDAHFRRVFGYGTRIDPTTETGPCVEKSEDNAAHDGRILQAPLPQPRPGAIYQRVIDNRHGEHLVMDIRVPVVGGLMPFVYLKYRRIENRFANDNTRVEVRPTDSVLSREEQRRIMAFVRAFGLDLGDLDVLRDRRDGRIYIVDVNKTPAGPPAQLGQRAGRRVIRLMAEAFDRNFLQPALLDTPVLQRPPARRHEDASPAGMPGAPAVPSGFRNAAAHPRR